MGKGQRWGSKCPVETEGCWADYPMPLPHHNPLVCVPPHPTAAWLCPPPRYCLAVPPIPHAAAWLYPHSHPVAARCAFPPQAIWLYTSCPEAAWLSPANCSCLTVLPYPEAT